MVRARDARRLLFGFAAYLVVLGWVAWPWIRVADRAVPASPLIAFPDDARLIATQVRSGLRVRRPADFFEAPIFHPAPGQLLGSEIFASSLPLAAPFLAATGNATLAASGAALLTYPLAAIAMDALLLALGCVPVAAWAAGLLFAMGPLRIPGNLQVLQYPNFWLPVVALSLTALRVRPTAIRTAWAGLALGLAAVSSLYMAVMAATCAAAWFVFELARGGPGRVRYAACATAAALAAAIPVGGLGWSHARRVGLGAGSSAWTKAPEFVAALGRAAAAGAGPLFWALAAAGLASAVAKSRTRSWALAGAAVLLVACLLLSGPRIFVGELSVPGPFALLLASPLRFFRAPWRFVVLAGFGGSLLAAAALDAASRRVGPRAGAVAALAVAALFVAGTRIAPFGLDVFDGQVNPVYDEVAQAVRARGEGPLLELPIDAGRDAMNGSESRVPVGDSMVGSTRHGLPLVWGFTGYPPAHEPILRRMIASLDQPGTLADLVDVTHARWILLRPPGDWQDPGQRERLLGLPGTTVVASRDGWDLLRVGLEPRRPELFRAIAAGPLPGHTPLGSPVDGPRDLQAGVRVEASPAQVAPGERVHLALTLRNLSREPWPATDAAGLPGGIGVVVERRRAGASGTPETVVLGLPRDLLPGESLRLPVGIEAPREPGEFRVTAFPHRPGGPRARLRLETRPGEDVFRVRPAETPRDPPGSGAPAGPGSGAAPAATRRPRRVRRRQSVRPPAGSESRPGRQAERRSASMRRSGRARSMRPAPRSQSST